MKKRYFIILLISLFVFIPFNIEARDVEGNDTSSNEDWIECMYKDDSSIIYYYNRTKNQFKASLDLKKITKYQNLENKLSISDFIDTSGKLKCPSQIDYKRTAKMNKNTGLSDVYTTIVDSKKVDISYEKGVLNSKRYNENSSSSQNIKTCYYSTDLHNTDIVLDIENKKILTILVDGEDATNKSYGFDDIWKDDSCTSEINMSCDSSGCFISKDKVSGSPTATINEKKSTGVQKEYEYNQGEEVSGCEVIPDSIQKWIKILLNFIKYIALVLVIILGTIDFIKAASSGEPDAVKKAGQSFLKRVVAVILLFLLPIIVELILNLINLYGATDDCFNISQ